MFRIREIPRKPDVVKGLRGFPPFLHTRSGKVTKIILRRLPCTSSFIHVSSIILLFDGIESEIRQRR